MVMLISVFRAIVNKLNYESFDTISMENIKKLSKKLITLSFFHKMFLKIVSKLILLRASTITLTLY